MAEFEVKYSFTCKQCKKPNNQRIGINAADQVQAYRAAKLSAACIFCGAEIDPEQEVTSTVKQIGVS